jgi:hypothetical protein
LLNKLINSLDADFCGLPGSVQSVLTGGLELFG